MARLKKFNPQFITNEAGEKLSIVLPIAEFEKILDDLEDLTAIADRREEPTISHEDLLKELREDDLI